MLCFNAKNRRQAKLLSLPNKVPEPHRLDFRFIIEGSRKHLFSYSGGSLQRFDLKKKRYENLLACFGKEATVLVGSKARIVLRDSKIKMRQSLFFLEPVARTDFSLDQRQRACLQKSPCILKKSCCILKIFRFNLKLFSQRRSVFSGMPVLMD